VNPSLFVAGAAVGCGVGVFLPRFVKPLSGALRIDQRVRLRLEGRVFLRWEGPPRFREPTAIWGFLCLEHGLVEDYLHGYYERLDCPRCDYSTEFGLRL